MNKTLKRITYVWGVIMAILIITLFLVGCGSPNEQYPCEGEVYTSYDRHYEPSNYIPPAPDIDINSLIKETTDPRYHFPE